MVVLMIGKQGHKGKPELSEHRGFYGPFVTVSYIASPHLTLGSVASGGITTGVFITSGRAGKFAVLSVQPMRLPVHRLYAGRSELSCQNLDAYGLRGPSGTAGS